MVQAGREALLFTSILLGGKGCHDLLLRLLIWQRDFQICGVAVGDSFWITELLAHFLPLDVQFGFQFAYLVITKRTCWLLSYSL